MWVGVTEMIKMHLGGQAALTHPETRHIADTRAS